MKKEQLVVPEDGLAVRDGRQGGEPAKSIGPGLRRILNMMVVLRMMMKIMAMTRKDYPPSSGGRQCPQERKECG